MAGLTHASPTADVAVPLEWRSRRISPGFDAWRKFRRHRMAVASVVILAVLTSAVVLGPFVWRLPINEIDFTARLGAPGWQHPFGTDDLGQDLLARMLYGGRISLAVGFAAMAVAIIAGTVIGAISGISRGSVDAALMWITDLFLALPQLPLLLLVIYLFRDFLKNLVGPEGGVFILIVMVIGAFRWMPVARLVRAQFLSLREKEFVEAARALGATTPRLVIRHILPDSLGPVIVAGTIDVAAAIIAESTLSFLGLGFPPDIPTGAVSCSTPRIIYQLKANNKENKNKEVFVCISDYGHSTGFNMAIKESRFYSKLNEMLKYEYKPYEYQCWGPDIYNKFFKTMNSIPDGFNLSMDVVYAHDCHHVKELFGKKSKFTDESIGCHWYGGNSIWGRFINETRGGEFNLPDNVIGNLINANSTR